MQLERTEKAWGHESLVVNTEEYCGKILHVEPGYQCSLHYHKLKAETFYVLEGEGYIDYGVQVPGTGEWITSRRHVHVGDVSRLQRYEVHRFGTTAGMILVEFSTHHDDSDSYRIQPSGRLEEQHADGEAQGSEGHE